MNYIKYLIGYESRIKCISCNKNSEKSNFTSSCENKCHICNLCIQNLLKEKNSICPNQKCSGKLPKRDTEPIDNTEVDSFQNHKNKNIQKVESIIFSQNFSEFDTIKNSSIFSECVSPIEFDNTPWCNDINEYFPNNTRLNQETKSSEIIKANEAVLKENNLPLKGKIINCPFCSTPKDVKNESELVRCLSMFCKGKNYFCKLCKQGVNLADQSIHFPKGLWMGICTNS